MTKELYEKLKQYEDIMKYAIKMDYLRVTPDVFQQLHKLYNELTGKTLSKSQLNCNSCRLRMLKEMGKEYYAYEPEVIEVEKVENEEKEEIKEVKKVKTVKRGRPRKIDLG